MTIPMNSRARLLPIVFPAIGLSALLLAGSRTVSAQDTTVAGNEKVADIIANYEGRGTLADDTPPTPPAEAVNRFRVRDGFEIELVTSEPDIGQPLFVSWDSRGRLWVVQYLQYQFPAGLKIIEYDNHLRAQFDKVPEPPPHGTPGQDTITVFEDSDGDGYYDRHHDAISGLNIATAVETGHGGIWVANPPYLLFYPDQDGDGLPDGDPEVRLSGFGIEDTHSVMNSLEWGPDGWLYGVNGSTTTGKVRCPATDQTIAWQGQMIWRYHPGTRHFEIYAEGGGNTFSLEIDSVGRVFSGTNNGNTRGMYYPQGGYGKKGWGKHGPLTNPYAFGYFNHLRHEGDTRRFAQAFCIYEGGLYPEEYRGRIIAPNSLHNVVWVSRIEPDTSTYRTVDEENLIESDDRWFRPVFAGVGPDGCVYMADWYDTRLSHVRPVDDWHKDSGRIYRVQPTGSRPAAAPADLTTLSADELFEILDHPNLWTRRRAVLEIGWKNHSSIVPRLRQSVDANEGQRSLESLWALNLLGSIDSEWANRWLRHPSPDIRRWMIRLIGDSRSCDESVADTLARLAEEESDIHVRSQLAASAKRLPPEVGLAMVRNLLLHSSDLDDLHLPLMTWWALEAHAESGRDIIHQWIDDQTIWELPLYRTFIAGRLMRRYAMAGGDANYLSCARLLERAPDEAAGKTLMTGLQLAFQGTSIADLPGPLTRQMDDYASRAGENDLVLAVLRKDAAAIAKGGQLLTDTSGDPVVRLELARAFGDIADPKVVPHLLRTLGLDQHSALKRVALQALANYDQGSIPETILRRYGSTLPSEHEVRSTADRVLASRVDWAKQFLGKIELAHIKARDISPDVVQLLLQHKDPGIDETVGRHWPYLAPVTSEEIQNQIEGVKGILRKTSGDPNEGYQLYRSRCAVCHKLFGEGSDTGPDLTGYERHNPDFWLPAIIDPSLEIREEYANFILTTEDQRVLIGMVAEQNPRSVTLRDAGNQLTTIARDQIAELKATPTSLMPPGLLLGLTDQQIADLFAYLMRETPE